MNKINLTHNNKYKVNNKKNNKDTKNIIEIPMLKNKWSLNKISKMLNKVPSEEYSNKNNKPYAGKWNNSASHNKLPTGEPSKEDKMQNNTENYKECN